MSLPSPRRAITWARRSRRFRRHSSAPSSVRWKWIHRRRWAPSSRSAIRSPMAWVRRRAPTIAGRTSSPIACRQPAGTGAVANVAISGNRVLSPGMGESALARFDEDVLSLPNVKYMIVFEGVNDIGNRFGPPGPSRGGGLTLDQPEITVEQMIAGFKQLIARAHDKGIKVIGSPIGPLQGRCLLDRRGRSRAPEDQRLDPAWWRLRRHGAHRYGVCGSC